MEPICQRPKTGDGARDGAERTELAGDHISGEANGTGVFLATIRTYPYPFPNRYHALAMTASAMADGEPPLSRPSLVRASWSHGDAIQEEKGERRRPDCSSHGELKLR